MNKIEVGILGATGMVGQNFIKFLEGHPWFEVTWLGASDRSAGKKYRDACKWNLNGVAPDSVRDRIVEECKPGNAPRLLFSATDASVATEIEQAFAMPAMWWSPIRRIIAWSAMSRCWCRRSIPTI